MPEAENIRQISDNPLEQQIRFISSLFSNTHLRKKYLSFVVDNLKVWTGCECVGIRVIYENMTAPYEAFVGFTYDFWEHENCLSIKEHQCSCIRVATGQPDPFDLQIMSQNGSIWTNDLQEFGKTIPEASYGRYRGKCIECGFNSLAVITIKFEDRIIGLIHIADSRVNMLPIDKIVLLESVSNVIGEIIVRFVTEDRFQTQNSYLYDFAPIGYVTLDCKGIIRNANLNCARLLGIERSLLIGDSFFRFVSDESFRVFLANAFERQASDPFEALLHSEGRHLIHVRFKAILTGSKDECLVAIIDITRSKLAEKTLDDKRLQLQETNESLEKSVDACVEELLRMDKMLLVQNRQAALGEMIGFIAHQWRQPLNTLSLNIQALPLCYENGHLDKELLDKTATDAMMVIKHMTQTIDNFSNFFKPNNEAVTFKVNRLLADTASLIHDTLKFDRITLDINTQGDLCINGYPSECSQALLNIILNARDALLEHEIDQPRISISSFMKNDKTVITITDNAGGVPEEIIGRIFDPYFTTKSPDKGTGIGLFMAQTIINKKMGGRLTVRNINGGAEFRIEV